MDTDIKAGIRVKQKYMKCPYTEKKCQWMFEGKHLYSFLDNACYLSGNFKLKCPE